MKDIPQSKIEILLWLLRLRRRIRVTGASMRPTLNVGDELFYDPRAYRSSQPDIDEIVVACDPRQRTRKIIKRVRDVREDGRIDLRSDNAIEGADSRQFGPVSPDLILGRVTSRF